MKKAYMYTRVSTAMQVDNYSLEAQRNKILAIAGAEEIKVIREYSDEGHSGKNITGRPAFQEMMADIEAEKDKIDYVMVFKVSRFGRNAADALASLERLKAHGVHLWCVEDKLVSDGVYGSFMFTMMAGMAELERENIITQTMSGRKQKARLGAWNGGFAPYGYDLVNGKLQIREDEAKVIRDLFKIYVETAEGANGTAKKLNEMYIKNARPTGYLNRFTGTFVKGVVKNPVYKGMISFGRRHTTPKKGKKGEYHVVWQQDQSQIIYAPGQHEAIVSEELWDAAYRKYQSLSAKKEKIEKDHEYILSGLVRCPDCEAPMYGIPNNHGKTGKDGKPYKQSYSYKCRNQTRQSGHVCSSHTQYSAAKIDAAVRDIIFDMVNDENFKAAIEELIGAHVDEEKVKEQIQDQEKELRRLQGVVSRIEAQLNALDYDNPNVYQMEESLNKRLTDVMTGISEAEDNIVALNERLADIGNEAAARDSVYSVLTVFSEIYDELYDIEKKNLMQAIIDRIELYPKEGKTRGGQWIKAIHFKFPLSYHGQIVEEIVFDKEGHFSRPNQTKDETVVLMGKE